MLDFHVKTGTRFALRGKRLFEISEVEITRVDCSSTSLFLLCVITREQLICLNCSQSISKVFKIVLLFILFIFFFLLLLFLCTLVFLICFLITLMPTYLHEVFQHKG